MDRPIECGFSKIGIDVVVEALVDLKKSLDDIGVEFFLACGILLGIIRDNTLIGADKDFDLGVMNEFDLYRIEEKLGPNYKEVGFDGFQKDVKKGKILWIKKYFDKYCLPIEFQAHYVKGNYVFYNRNMGEKWTYEKGRLVWRKRLFNNFKRIKFAGVEFNVPNPPEEYLITLYGKNWRVPKQYTDWRYNCCNLFEGWWK